MAPETPSGASAGQLAAYRRIFDLGGRTALVTGANRGIGRAIALGLAAYGSAVAVHFRNARTEADSTVVEISAGDGKAKAFMADLSQSGEARRLVREASSALGSIDILVINASVEIEQPFGEVTDAAFDAQVNLNFRGTVQLMQEVLPAMAARGWGRVLTLGSVQQATPNPRKAVYAATKAAQASLVVSMARAYGAQGVTVNNLAPGLIVTDRTSALRSDAEAWRRKLDQIPVGRAGEPDEMVGAALLLCSPAGAYITGQNLLADGGLGIDGARR